MIKYYQENFGAKSTVINVIILSKQSIYLRDIIYAIKDMGSKLNINFVFANEDNSIFTDLIQEVKAKTIDIPLIQLLEGFYQMGNRASSPNSLMRVPCISNKGKTIEIPEKVSQTLNQYFKIVHLDILQESTVNASDKTFYQGRAIEWKELDNNYDVTREITRSIYDTLRNWLQSRSDSGVFTLVHHPGSGGTTIARRIAFMIYQEYPVLLLNETIVNFDENKIVDRIHQLFTITELPTLIIVDNSNISKAQIEQLKRTIEHRLVKAIIFTVEGGFNVPTKQKNIFYLKGTLEKAEMGRFLDKFSKEFNTQIDAFNQIIVENNPATLTPFYFGLIAYEERFITIEKYVRIRMSNITQKERDLLKLLAFFNFYAKGKSRDVPHFVISSFLDVDEDFIRLQNHINNPQILDLIIETEPDQYIYWRTIHPIIAFQILKETFEPNSTDELNPTQLEKFAIRVIECLREISNQTSYEILQLLYSLFVQRNDSYAVDDTDDSTAYTDNMFSTLIGNLQTNQLRIEVFKVLTKEFPNEHPHFWGHFSRLYSIDKDFANALRTIDIAIGLDSSDYRLFHIKGMCYRAELYNLKDKYFGKKDELTEDVINEIQKLFEAAELEFQRTCELAPYKEHGYVSFVQMAIQVIEFGFSISLLKNDRRDYTKFITNPANKWYQTILATTKEYIDLYNSRNIETTSQRLEQYQIQILKFWGEKETIINAWNGLIGSQHDQNFIRRNLAYAYLAKGEFDWKLIKGKDLLKIQELAAQNLEGSLDVRDLNLWFEVSRRLNVNILILIGRLEELEFKIETIQSAYYLMCLYAVKVLSGGAGSALDSYELNVKKIRERRDGPYNKIFCPEWLGSKENSVVLVNSKDVGKWNKERQFFEDGNWHLLRKLKGKVVKYNRPQEGFIEIEGSGILAVYQPGKFGHYNNDAEMGTPVEFYVGFNYDGARAFFVTNI